VKRAPLVAALHLDTSMVKIDELFDNARPMPCHRSTRCDSPRDRNGSQMRGASATECRAPDLRLR